jgi:hypothetical protein
MKVWDSGMTLRIVAVLLTSLPIDAENDRAFERGWLPVVLRPDSTDIEETHDIDTNRLRGTFMFTDSIHGRLSEQCRRISSDESEVVEEFECGRFWIRIDGKTQRGEFQNAYCAPSCLRN